MSYLFFDTETTGLPKDWKAPLTDFNNWPRMIQLGFLLYDDKGIEVDEGNFIIRPEGFTIPSEVSKIHGITTEKALDEGIILLNVLEEFSSFIRNADILVAHNMAFDEKIVGAEFLRKGMDNVIAFKRKICTMRSSKEYCGLPGKYGLKNPRLSELHFKLFGHNFENAHDAFADIKATAACFWELKRLRIIR
ncbi:MAG: 3'-5' exonuclease [Chitinophagales bacterium]|nr:3'-5' exonuclease [Chitinophagales bacterium]